MTAKESAKAHWPNAVMLIAGIGLVAFAWLKPGDSDELISKVVEFLGYVLTGGSGLNAMRVGAKKESEQLPDAVAGKILDRLAVVQYLGDENKQSVAALLATVAANKQSCDRTRELTGELIDVTHNLAGHVQAHSQWIQQQDKTFVPPWVDVKAPRVA